jgi:regulatory protein YycH of two-component signal transduction system YycFG
MMLSEKAKSLTRKIESIVMKEQPKVPLVSLIMIKFRRKYIVVTFTLVNRCQQIFLSISYLKIHSALS